MTLGSALRRLFTVLLAALSASAVIAMPSPSAAYGRLPLTFETNQGQAPSAIKFVSRGNGYDLFLTPTEALLETAAAQVVRATVVGGDPAADMTALEPLPGKSNYFIGNDPHKWRTNIPTYARVKCSNVYPGIDLTYYGRDGQLEFDFVLAPRANAKRIELAFSGVTKTEIDGAGDLLLHTSAGAIRQHRPHVYQDVNGLRREVRGDYVLKAKNRVGFRIGAYDRDHPLVIDPVLVYSTYLGGSGEDTGIGIAVDAAGNAYVVGGTLSTNFPTANALQPSFGGGGGSGDAFIAKLNPSGTGLVYSTYLGGNGSDDAIAVAIDAAGNAYITGQTDSTNFPTVTPLQGAFAGGIRDAYIAKLNSTGSALVYSTYLGGNDYDSGRDIAVDTSGYVYLTGGTYSVNFPTANAIQPAMADGGINDAIAVKLNPAGTALEYSTYLGGNDQDIGYGIAIDAAGNAYICGFTQSTNFPTVNPLQPTRHGLRDGFVAKLNAAGSALAYSTYLGGSSGDYAVGIAVDAVGSAYVTGPTASADFPTVNAMQPAFGGYADSFITKLNASGSAMIYSTYLGGSGDEFGASITVDGGGNAYVTGNTASTNFPLVSAVQTTLHGNYDAYVAKLDPAGSMLLFSTYLGGSGSDAGDHITTDDAGSIYVIGYTNSKNFPTANAFQRASGGGADAFVAKLGEGGATPRFNGGGQRTDVNEFLTYTAPTQTVTTLPAGTSSFDVHIFYGPTILATTFEATLNGTPISGFTAVPGTDQTVTIPLTSGRNTLVLRVDGVRTDGHIGTDRDRLVFIVP